MHDEQNTLIRTEVIGDLPNESIRLPQSSGLVLVEVFVFRVQGVVVAAEALPDLGMGPARGKPLLPTALQQYGAVGDRDDPRLRITVHHAFDGSLCLRTASPFVNVEDDIMP